MAELTEPVDVIATTHPSNTYKTLTHPTINATPITPFIVSIPYWTANGQFTFVSVNSVLNMNNILTADQTKQFLGYDVDPTDPLNTPREVYAYFIKFQLGTIKQESDPKWTYVTEDERNAVFHELYAVITTQ